LTKNRDSRARKEGKERIRCKRHLFPMELRATVKLPNNTRRWLTVAREEGSEKGEENPNHGSCSNWRGKFTSAVRFHKNIQRRVGETWKKESSTCTGYPERDPLTSKKRVGGFFLVAGQCLKEENRSEKMHGKSATKKRERS